MQLPARDNSTAPTFEPFFENERRLPQHNPDLPSPEGRHGRYLYVSNQRWGVGWNNVLQNILLLSHMAYKTNRAFVFVPYVWHRGNEPLVDHWGEKMASVKPLSAFVGGPLVGGHFPSDDPAPRAVTEEYFLSLFPTPEDRTRISIKEVNEEIGGPPPVMNTYEKYIQILHSDAPVLELFGNRDHLFNCHHFGDASLLDLWHTLSTSPILTHFQWSPLVLYAVKDNAQVVHPTLAQEVPPYQTIPGLMVVHVRRGDYEQHYRHLAKWSSDYMGWCKTPGLSSTFDPPRESVGTESEEKNLLYEKHAYPNTELISRRIHEVREAWETRADTTVPLRSLHIMTNGDAEWVEELKRLVRTDSSENAWERISSWHDMHLDNEQRYLTIAIDQAIADRAEVFVGNGFSSASANVVLMRRIHNIDPASTFFW